RDAVLVVVLAEPAGAAVGVLTAVDARPGHAAQAALAHPVAVAGAANVQLEVADVVVAVTAAAAVAVEVARLAARRFLVAALALTLVVGAAVMVGGVAREAEVRRGGVAELGARALVVRGAGAGRLVLAEVAHALVGGGAARAHGALRLAEMALGLAVE